VDDQSHTTSHLLGRGMRKPSCHYCSILSRCLMPHPAPPPLSHLHFYIQIDSGEISIIEVVSRLLTARSPSRLLSPHAHFFESPDQLCSCSCSPHPHPLTPAITPTHTLVIPSHHQLQTSQISNVVDLDRHSSPSTRL